MRKNISSSGLAPSPTDADSSIDLEHAATVEITSEEPGYPIEAALLPGQGSEWRAAEPGPQTLRLHFDSPQQISRIQLRFEVTGVPRTQEFSLRWSSDGGAFFQDLLRQQFNFSPPSTAVQDESYRVDLSGVTDLELTLIPDVSRGDTRASLKALRLW